MENITQLAMEVASLKSTLALQQEQIDAAQVTSDNVWILGRAFTVLTMVSAKILSSSTADRGPMLHQAGRNCSHSLLFAASWVRVDNTALSVHILFGKPLLNLFDSFLRFAMLEAGLVSTRSTSNVRKLRFTPADQT